ncbi:hypothetical protein ILYODFUR_002047 [Ilyodon furcidens]|uniref:Uncharacterized protein n=1 Tax=Ilyodon furcidens TaxID=33524 RepID=A0ABV0UCN8_9TELE
MPLNPYALNPLPTAQWHTPTSELHPQKADEATPTQRKLHTQPHSKHAHHILPPPHSEALPQPPPAGATGQTPSSTTPTMEPPTPHQDGTNSPSKRSPASGKHSGPVSPTTPLQPYKHSISLPLQR